MKIESYKTKGETRYRFRAYVGMDPVTGKKIRVRKAGFETKKEAQLAYLDIVSKQAPADYRAVTFRQLYETWIEIYKLGVKDSTLRVTVHIFDDYILPRFAGIKITDITPLMAQKFYNELAESFKAPRKRYAYFAKILDFARKQGLINQNPAEMIERPRIKKKASSAKESKENYYTKEELQQFLILAEEKLSFMWFVFFRLLAYSGMRRGEALALTWEDMNFSESTVSINKTVTLGPQGAYLSDTPKTDKSTRIILLDAETMAMISKLQDESNSDYIFANRKGNFITLSQPVRQLHKVVDDSDLKYISPHGFRHTHCSLLFSAGVSIPEVQDRLGHSDIKTTLDIYNHVYQKDKETALEKFLEFMK